MSRVLLSLLVGLVVSGCTTKYIPPSGRADLANISSGSMQESFAAKPAAQFPASIAMVRVQAPRYRNFYTEREGGVHGHGRFSVVTVKEFEEEADLKRLGSLPNVGGLISIPALLFPDKFESDKELREAAARLKADMVLLYTFNTSFHENDAAKTLSVVTLGLSPTRVVYVRVNASAILVDTRTGFIYSAYEANEKRQVLSNAWASKESADRARRDAEKAAFKGLVSEFEKGWPAVIERAKKGA